jgi:hypothetical protein
VLRLIRPLRISIPLWTPFRSTLNEHPKAFAKATTTPQAQLYTSSPSLRSSKFPAFVVSRLRNNISAAATDLLGAYTPAYPRRPAYPGIVSTLPAKNGSVPGASGLRRSSYNWRASHRHAPLRPSKDRSPLPRLLRFRRASSLPEPVPFPEPARLLPILGLVICSNLPGPWFEPRPFRAGLSVSSRTENIRICPRLPRST